MNMKRYFVSLIVISTLTYTSLTLVWHIAPSMACEAKTCEDFSRAVRAFVTNFDSEGISVVDPEKGRSITNIKTGYKSHGVAIAPDGKAVYVSNEGDDKLSIIDPVKNSFVATIKVGEGPNQIAVSSDGRYVFVTLHELMLSLWSTWLNERWPKLCRSGALPTLLAVVPMAKRSM